MESRILLGFFQLNQSLFRGLLSFSELLLQLKSLIEMASLHFLLQVLDLSVLSVLVILESFFVALKSSLGLLGLAQTVLEYALVVLVLLEHLGKSALGVFESGESFFLANALDSQRLGGC